MPEEQQGAAGDQLDEAPEGREGGGQAKDAAGRKARKTFAARATANLRAARRSLQETEWQPEERARFLMEEANVLALLELSDAIRQTRDGE